MRNHEVRNKQYRRGSDGSYEGVAKGDTKTKLSLFGRRTTTIFVVVLVIVLVGSSVILQLTPTSQEEEPISVLPLSPGLTTLPQQGLKVNFKNAEYDFPKSLPIFQSISPTRTATELVEEISKKLNIPKDPTPYSKNIWTNYDSGEQLLLSQDLEKITYLSSGDDKENIASPGEIINVDKATKKATEFLNGLSLYNNFSVQQEGIGFLNQETVVSSTTDASVIVIPFKYELGGYATYFSSSFQPYLSIIVNKNYRVAKADLYPPPPTLQQLANKKILSISDIETQIRAGNISIITTGNETGIFDEESLSEFLVTDVTIEYRIEPSTTLIIPYFRIEGEAVEEKDGVPLYITAITPAITTTNAR